MAGLCIFTGMYTVYEAVHLMYAAMSCSVSKQIDPAGSSPVLLVSLQVSEGCSEPIEAVLVLLEELDVIRMVDFWRWCLGR